MRAPYVVGAAGPAGCEDRGTELPLTHQGICGPESQPGGPSNTGLLPQGEFRWCWGCASGLGTLAGAGGGRAAGEPRTSRTPFPRSLSPPGSRGLVPGQERERGLCPPAFLCQCLNLVVGIIPSSAHPCRATTGGARPGTWPSEPHRDTISPTRARHPWASTTRTHMSCSSLPRKEPRSPQPGGEEGRCVGDPVQTRSYDPRKS